MKKKMILSDRSSLSTKDFQMTFSFSPQSLGDDDQRYASDRYLTLAMTDRSRSFSHQFS